MKTMKTMKKSEIYHYAQIAVLNAAAIAPETKLEVLRVLIDDESLATYTEEQEDSKNAETV